MTDKELFEKICRDGECWHEFEFWNAGVGNVCGKCKKWFYWNEKDQAKLKMPDFTTWEGFGWLWERCIEKDWWRTFKNYIISGDCADVNENYINPTRFVKALKEYFEEQDK